MKSKQRVIVFTTPTPICFVNSFTALYCIVLCTVCRDAMSKNAIKNKDTGNSKYAVNIKRTPGAARTKATV